MSKTNYYLSAAVIANEYVKKKMTIGASNKLRIDFLKAWQCSGSLVNTGEMRKYVDKQMTDAINNDTQPVHSPLDYNLRFQKIYLEKSAVGAELYGCGNCGEQSAIAFVFLRNQKTFPLDWMEVNNYEHAFVIIGRARGSDATNPITWGNEAVICDPWRDVVATVTSQKTYFANRRPNWLYGEIS
jgi:hypothetical protein